MKNNTRNHFFEHTWETEITVDEGVYFTGTQRIDLYFSPSLGKYVVSGKGADPSLGRHWNRDGIPDKLFFKYTDALRAYLTLANRYAPSDVIRRVESDVRHELGKEGLE